MVRYHRELRQGGFCACSCAAIAACSTSLYRRIRFFNRGRRVVPLKGLNLEKEKRA